MFTNLNVLIILAAAAYAEPPGYNFGQFQRQEAAPYAPSGWRPSGPAFRLPQPQTVYGPPASPVPSYGPPSEEYGAPPQAYGPPQEGTTTEEAVTTTELPATTEGADLEAEELGSGDSENRDDSGNEEEGTYYIYHPSGLLQRVVYATKDDVRNMAFSAKLKYENVPPIKGPIYTYDPETLVFKRL